MSPADPSASGVSDALAALDWQEITCQSEAGCTNRATHVVHRHAVDRCNQPNLGPSGNVVDILCVGCMRTVKAQVLQQLDRIARGPGAYCLTCGAPVQKLSDIMRKTVQLRSYA
ncbi:hypothetical protein K3U93_21120 [Mycobacterium malmoense]|uniref:Uncharacterized protein n=1 Tax=Mycobacterium malmoense TaxID=1780 RepID=A0ABX3SVI1_MYCMA|nr:hypothetical protein [Mycobacterium malmoense]OIN80355.1 hypothetical protein BMG05_13675 [Mycobacterium malmoense]ORA84578.1 hypothetical protein BST29_05250 [Mycobacterium malmoense]QZA17077.1 hypothetical protein K3U93_21120 [Mycobacterium malmoense]UNB93870.1 hypothetical protein H5T25_21095 [Mycobacterium malmoense]